MPSLDRQRVQALFGACLELDATARDALLHRECAGDDALRAEVEQLLANDTTEDAVAAIIADSATRLDDDRRAWQGRRIGAWRLLEVLGHGGMGSVFLAARDDAEYDARVAIKLIRGFPTPRALAHLRRERQLLATLEHPGIARLLDGGTTEDGEPWLAIEYVDGMLLSDWCARRRPSLRQRLVLLHALCGAVHHAHQRLIVHSDLKPGNVLVREDGKPVLLDFGIARLLDATDLDSRLTAARAYTPMYASPEQVAGHAVTSASDVHALGLILFELLAGSPQRATVTGKATRPRLPSVRAAQAGEDWIRADAARVRGELDQMVAKATDDEPTRRYSSAAAFADDIERFLDGRPLLAAPDSRTYRALKFVRRHRVASAASLAVVLGVLAFATWLGAERARALRAESAARVEAATANRVTSFLLAVFRNADPATTRGREPTVRDVLDSGREQLASDLADEPLVRTRLLAAIGEIYTSIGQPKSAIATLDDAVAGLRSVAPGSLALAAALNELCRAHEQMRSHVDARTACEESMALRVAQLPAGHVDIAHTANALGVVEQEDGNDAAALAHFSRALAAFEAAGDDRREDIASTHHNLGYAAAKRKEFAMARDQYSLALAGKRALWGDAHPKTLNSLHGLALAEIGLGHREDGRRTLEDLLVRRTALHGADSKDVADVHLELASVMQDLGDLAGAEIRYAAAEDVLARLGLGDSLNAAMTANNHATLAEERGDIARARALYRRSFALRSALVAEGHPARVRGALNLARFQARHPAADDTAIAAEAMVPSTRTATAIEQFDLDLLVAERTLRGGSTDAALVALQALDPPRTPGDYRRRLRRAELIAIALLESAQADAARSAYRAAFDGLDVQLGEHHPAWARAAVRAAMIDSAAGHDDEARRLLAAAIPVLQSTQVGSSPVRMMAEAWQAKLAGRPRGTLRPEAWF
jgi:eukaryotic-like serine/threonine-protein kinase